MERADDKLSFLDTSKLENLEMKTIIPSKRGNWVNQIENEWDDLIPLASKAEKKGTKGSRDRAIFKFYSLGVSTNRDDYVFDKNEELLNEKASYLRSKYLEVLNQKPKNKDYEFGFDIKWSDSLKSKAIAARSVIDRQAKNIPFLYRPYSIECFYPEKIFSDRLTGNHVEIYGASLINENSAIYVSGDNLSKDFSALGVEVIASLDLLEKTQCLPRHRYTEDGTRIDNITDWSLRKFREQYSKSVTKSDIFHYCYGILHDPIYRETYAINLKREFPRIPFYPNFKQWCDWGQGLMALHIGYEDVQPLPLARQDAASKRAEGSVPKPILKSVPEAGLIKLDADTTLSGVPVEAWEYRLGNRSAIDWVLDQHKEKKPRDPTIREKFNTYRFADYKDHVIDLLGRVAKVSVETVKVTEAMKSLDRSDWS